MKRTSSKLTIALVAVVLATFAASSYGIKLSNPQEWRYNHPNFPEPNPGTRVSLQDVPSDEATLTLDVTDPSNNKGGGQIQFQDNGRVVLRVHLDPANPVDLLIVDHTGVLFQTSGGVVVAP